MYILALDDEQYVLESLVAELKQVFPEADIQKENRASAALSWAKELSERGYFSAVEFLKKP